MQRRHENSSDISSIFTEKYKYFKFKHFIKWMPRNYLVVLYTREKNGYYNWGGNGKLLKNKKCSYTLANEKMLIKYLKIMRRLCFNRCLKCWLSTHVENMKNKRYIWRGLFCRLLNMGSTELKEIGTHKRGI